MIRSDNHYYWVWRHNDTNEIACLVRNSYPVPFSACAEQVHAVLGLESKYSDPPEGVGGFYRNALHSDDNFTIAEWNTWHAFGICPTIAAYVKETRTRHDIIVWGWQRIEP